MKKILLTILLFSLLIFFKLRCGQNGDGPITSDQIVILVSLDGYRADYLDRNPSPNLSYLVEHGTRAGALIPSFPSKTFPNHYTLVTGLYPANHGIVSIDEVLSWLDLDTDERPRFITLYFSTEFTFDTESVCKNRRLSSWRS